MKRQKTTAKSNAGTLLVTTPVWFDHGSLIDCLELMLVAAAHIDVHLSILHGVLVMASQTSDPEFRERNEQVVMSTMEFFSSAADALVATVMQVCDKEPEIRDAGRMPQCLELLADALSCLEDAMGTPPTDSVVQ